MSNVPTDTVDVSPDDLRRLAALLEKHNLTELRYEQGETRVTLRTAAYFRQQGATAAVTLAAAPGLPTDENPFAEAEQLSDDDSDSFAGGAASGVRIEAPIMGVFYRSASPSDPAFVEVGDAVEVGQAVGLIEAMKVFSEVKSEVAGIVREIPVVNKSLVQPGDALVILSTE